LKSFVSFLIRQDWYRLLLDDLRVCIGDAVSDPSITRYFFNPLNAELNPICHLLVWLGDLMFMGTRIVSIFQYISNKMQRYTVYLYLETALHVLDGTSTHHQERKELYLQHLVFVTPLLLPAAIVAGSSNGVTNNRCCKYSSLRS
jgi:hypothetical protein